MVLHNQLDSIPDHLHLLSPSGLLAEWQPRAFFVPYRLGQHIEAKLLKESASTLKYKEERRRGGESRGERGGAWFEAFSEVERIWPVYGRLLCCKICIWPSGCGKQIF